MSKDKNKSTNSSPKPEKLVAHSLKSDRIRDNIVISRETTKDGTQITFMSKQNKK